ncbi:MAG: aminopeptidase P family protein [Candidatus Omnitrophica bacterium]|nr:aminopeptidase P family protein [Candidatus Omnitrophota bacterium]
MVKANYRIQRLRRSLRCLRVDAFLISNPSNIYYMSGFRGTDSYCLISLTDCFIITDFRYMEQAEKEAPYFSLVTGPKGLLKKTTGLIRNARLKRVGFESDHLTVKEAEVIGSARGFKFCPVFQLIEKFRIIKDAQEIAYIRKASNIAKGVLHKVIKGIKQGEREKDISLKIDLLLEKRGAEASAFETIVASGANASMPHARPTARRIKSKEPVVMDCGARFNGYNSDLTRSRFVGKIDKSLILIYSSVAEAQALAIKKVAPGVKISDIDKAARNYITKKGFGSHFGHAAGHGIGIDVHESPGINSKNHSTLKEGMVFSIEPAIYIPGWGGVRIEDLVLVTAKGHEVLTG